MPLLCLATIENRRLPQRQDRRYTNSMKRPLEDCFHLVKETHLLHNHCRSSR